MTRLVLAYLAGASHRSEGPLLRRYPWAESELARLLAAGAIEYHSLAPRSWRITARGRNLLRAEMARRAAA